MPKRGLWRFLLHSSSLLLHEEILEKTYMALQGFLESDLWVILCVSLRGGRRGLFVLDIIPLQYGP